MAKQRYIDTRFWHDTFVRKLNPLDRYLFLYFLTNDKTNICGIYELPVDLISNETGIEIEMLKTMMKRIREKVEYVEGWVFIKNFQKYQNYNSPKIKVGIEVEINKIPLKIKGKIEKLIGENIRYGYGIDTISHSNSNSNSNSNSIDVANATSKNMKKNKFGSYREDASSDSFESVVDSEKGPVSDERQYRSRANDAYWSLLHWAEKLRGEKFVSFKSQFKAMSAMRAIGIETNEIADRWEELAKDDFYKDKLDFWTVCKSFDKKPR